MKQTIVILKRENISFILAPLGLEAALTLRVSFGRHRGKGHRALQAHSAPDDMLSKGSSNKETGSQEWFIKPRQQIGGNKAQSLSLGEGHIDYGLLVYCTCKGHSHKN